MFIIVDDLKSEYGKKTTFEFWLNAQKDIQISNEKIEIIKDTAALDVEADYPENIRVFKSDNFCGTDQVPHYPIYAGHERWPVQKRIWMQTEETAETKIVTVLKVRPSSKAIKQTNVKKNENCITYKVGYDTNIYVNTSDIENIDTGLVSFSGTAALVGNDSFMLVNGTRLSINGTVSVSSDNNVSVLFDNNELSISSLQQDSEISILLPDNITLINEKGREITETSTSLGVTAKKHGEYTHLSVYNGSYNIKLCR